VTTLRPFRFGVLAGPPADAAAWRRGARRAEELGYSALLVPDHLGQEWGPLTSLAVAAEHTERIKLGTLMLAADLRPPVVLCKELLTLAHLAPGRLEVGLGAGWFAPDFARAGVRMDPPATRIERLDEATTVLKSLWRNGRISFEGKHFGVAEALGEPRPPAAAPVRWTLGGGGRRMLEVAVRHADTVSLSARMASGAKDSSFGRSATAAEFDRRLRWVRGFAGDRFAEIELQCLVFATAVVPDSARYAARVLALMFGLPAAEAMASPMALVGTPAEITERLIGHRERFGISYWVVHQAQMEQFGEVVATLTGC
jgi:probable F420-dependent oxidoreductase